ncbi:uncharacterized protein LOC111674875 isoform X2 [Lucilia cuprina]|uniref:uncharacterized protein LOC111674875 isoform X2 n=1 Tax=Lucilia cuprina TaxID=7375 RepID=UPI001F06EC50|nr:uncharacterized protein LOC111674875 isoform X2 [Lucilia cuprina]
MEQESVFVVNLIANVEKKKCLYDKSDPFYFNRNIKEKSWNEIGEKCSKSGEDCKHKWKLLRERFCKELKKMENSSGSEMSKAEWKFMQPMLFLKDFLAPRRTYYNVKHEDIETGFEQATCSEDSLLEPLMSFPTPPKKSMHTPDSLCQKFGETLENIERSLAVSIEQKNETTDESFMKTVLCLMRDLPLDKKDEFQAGVMQELYRLRKNCRKVKKFPSLKSKCFRIFLTQFCW